MRHIPQEQYQVYQYLVEYIETRGYSPLVTDIARDLKLDVGHIERILWQLQYWGYISYLNAKSQMIYLTNRVPQLPSETIEATKPKQHKPKKPRKSRTAVHHSCNRQRVYQFIDRYVAEHKYPPVLREIAAELGIGTTTAKYYVDRLRDQGYLTFKAGKSRSLRLTDKPFVATAGASLVVKH